MEESVEWADEMLIEASGGGTSTGAIVALVTAGIAVALQKVITAFAGWVLIATGRLFKVGDRITIGGVRGEVVKRGFIRTQVMEMGQSKGEQGDPPSTWVHARQYTGRVVTLSNEKIFDMPLYNYTQPFPYLWEELHVPVKYTDDRSKAEQIILDAVNRHTSEIQEKARKAREEFVRAFHLKAETTIEPKVYWTLTDNWLEISARFIVEETGARGVKDAISRDILAGFDAAKIGIGSTTLEITSFPPIKVESE
jgi:small-conductance mechanosensitive channel